MRILIILITLLHSYSAKAAETDYLSYIEKVEKLVEMTVSAKSCETAGMVIDWEGVSGITERLLTLAIRENVDIEGFAQPLILDTLRKKKDNEKYLSEYYQKHPEKIDEFTDHWAKRCAGLSKHYLTKQYISLPSE